MFLRNTTHFDVSLFKKVLTGSTIYFLDLLVLHNSTEVDWQFFWSQATNFQNLLVVCFDANRLWRPGQIYILSVLHYFCHDQFLADLSTATIESELQSSKSIVRQCVWSRELQCVCRPLQKRPHHTVRNSFGCGHSIQILVRINKLSRDTTGKSRALRCPGIPRIAVVTVI